jgi:membrane-bound metal-dependent hydrolase YbcI (DUF457 family)
LLSLNFFLAHTVSDYSFTNPMKLYGNTDLKDLVKHSLWTVLVFLAFSFDVAFSSATTAIIFSCAIVLHFIVDYLRIRRQIPGWLNVFQSWHFLSTRWSFPIFLRILLSHPIFPCI